MFEIPVEDFIFVVCALIGGGLLLITVLVDDILGAVFDFDIGGVSLMPLLLSFIAMFGVGGLFATQVLDVHGGQAALVGAGFGAVGMGIAYGIFSFLRRAEAPEPFSTRDLIGREVFVQIGIPAGRYGSVIVKAEGQTHEFTATASHDIPATSVVRVTGVAGSGLIVEALMPPTEPTPAPTTEEGSSDV